MFGQTSYIKRISDVATEIVYYATPHILNDTHTTLKWCETMHTETFELQMKHDGFGRTLAFPKNAFRVTNRDVIMSLVCAMLTDEGFSVSVEASPTINSTKQQQQTNTTYPPQLESSMNVVAASTDRSFLSAVSVYTVREKAAVEEARQKAEKEALDRRTMDFLRQCIQDGKGIELFKQKDGKYGYVLRMPKNSSIGDDILHNVGAMLPVIRDAVGPNETVEYTEDARDCTLHVMEK